jgi:hypothetical protein
MKLKLLMALLTGGLFLQGQWLGVVGGKPVVTGNNPPTYVSAGGDNNAGSGTLTISVTAGNHLVVWTYANDRTTNHTCSNNGTANTYVDDGYVLATGAGINLVGHLFHIKSLAATASITITCTGTTPVVTAIQYSGGTGDLDSVSAGANPSFLSPADNATTVTPSALTPSIAAILLINGYASLSGVSVTMTQIDSNFTTRASSTNGATYFVGAIGSRVVTASASYSDGWTIVNPNDQVAVLAAYK